MKKGPGVDKRAGAQVLGEDTPCAPSAVVIGSYGGIWDKVRRFGVIVDKPFED